MESWPIKLTFHWCIDYVDIAGRSSVRRESLTRVGRKNKLFWGNVASTSSSWSLESGCGAWANKPVSSTVRRLPSVSVGRWSAVSFAKTEATGTILKVWILTGEFQCTLLQLPHIALLRGHLKYPTFKSGTRHIYPSSGQRVFYWRESYIKLLARQLLVR